MTFVQWFPNVLENLVESITYSDTTGLQILRDRFDSGPGLQIQLSFQWVKRYHTVVS